MLPERPRLRLVEAFPVDLGKGEKAIALRDPAGIAENVVALPQQVLALLALFDGQRTIVDVQAEWAKRTGELVFSEQIEGFLDKLDHELFLEGERFERAQRALADRFRAAPARPAAHADGAYPAEPAALRAFLDGFFTMPGGPGTPPGTGDAHRREDGRLLRAVVAPHIDYRRGSTAYAHAFDAVARAGGADLYVIFGTAHQGGRSPYIFTKKPFATPLGIVPTDVAFIERLEKRLHAPLDREELLHRTEHSVEFEAVFLRFVEERLARRERAEIVPFICGSFVPFTESGRSPSEAAEVACMVEALREEIAFEEARGRRVICIAGADLAHIGPKFGHERPADEAFRRECEEKDRASLARAAAVDGEGFFDLIALEKDERNICGLACIYTMLKVLGDGGTRPRAGSGELLAYGQAPDPVAGSYVSFASLAYYAPK